MRTPFLGPAYQGMSTNFADDALINLFLETSVGPGGKGKGVLYMTPGLYGLIALGTVVRGMGTLNNILFVCSGNTVYWISSINLSTSTRRARHGRHHQFKQWIGLLYQRAESDSLVGWRFKRLSDHFWPHS